MIDLQWKPVRAVRLEDLDWFTQMQIVDQIRDTYLLWKTERRGIEDIWRQIDRHVNLYDPIYTMEQRADIFGFILKTAGGLGSKIKLADSFSHREGIVASMLKFLMQNGYDFFDPIPLDPLDSDKLLALKYYLMWLFDEMGFQQSFTPFCRDIVQYGIGIASYEWRREIVPRWKSGKIIDPTTGKPIVVDYEAQDVIYDAPKFTPLNLYYTVLDPSAEDVRTANLIFKRPMTPYEIVANRAYQGVDFNYANNAPEFGGNMDTPLEADREIARGNTSFASVTHYKGKKEVYEAWGDFTIGPVIYKNYVANVLDRRLIRFEPNPYLLPHKPFIIARSTTETGRVYGPSLLAAITGIQAAADTVVNQYIDWWTMEINRPLLVQANAIVRSSKDDKTKLPPISKDAVWNVRDTNGFKRLDWGSRAATPDPTQLLGVLQSQMERATGDSALMSGGTPQPYMKTGVAVTATDAGSAKFNMYAQNIEQESIVVMLNMTLDLLRQMSVPIKTFSRQDVPNGDEVTFDPAILANDIKFTLRGASWNATKQLQTNNLQNFLTTLASNPFFQPIINWVRAVVIMAEALGIRNARELLSPQAAMMLRQTPNMQPTFWDQVRGFFTGQPGQMPGQTPPPANPMQGPVPGQTPQMMTQQGGLDGGQFSGSIAPVGGGNAPGSTGPNVFDFAPKKAVKGQRR